MRLFSVHFVDELVLVLKVVGVVGVADPCDGEEDFKGEVSALAKELVHVGGASGFVIMLGKLGFKLVHIRLIGNTIGISTFVLKNVLPAILVIRLTN